MNGNKLNQMIRKIIIAATMIISLNAYGQVRYSSSGTFFSEYNEYKEEFGELVETEKKTILQFENNYERFGIVGKPELNWLVTNVTVEDRVSSFTGLDANLDEVYVIVDYENNTIKIVYESKGKTYLLGFYIETFKKY